MRDEHVVGDLRTHPDGTVDGWCWAPGRPRARLAFEILADDRVVAAGEAKLPRPDLAVPGMADTRHGFWLALPPGAIDRGTPCLLSARARGVVFGRRLLEPAGGATAEPAAAALQAALGALSERLAARVAPPRPPATRLRAAAGALAAALPARLGQPGADVGAARRVLGSGMAPLRLACPAAPRATLALRAVGGAPATLARLRALAPATFALDAETLLLDPGADARMALLPSLLPGLRLLPVTEADFAPPPGETRGAWLLLLDDEMPSPAGLEAVLTRLEAEAIALAVSRRLAGAASLPELPIAARTGLALAARRGLLSAGDTPASLLARARSRQAGCVVLAEPWTPPPCAP